MSFERVAIVGSAQTELREAWSDVQHVELISRATSEALAGTGLTIEDVDFVADSGSDVLDGRSISNCGFLGAMGGHHKQESRVEEDGLWAAAYAMAKIAGGDARVALAIAYSKPSESDVSAFWSTQTEPFFQRPVGLDQTVASGLQASQYLELTEASEEAFATVAAQAWRNAGGNPWVETGEIPDVDEIAESDLAASPLRELQMARPVDGAVVVVLASQQIAHKVTESPVWITGLGQAMDQHHFAQRRPGTLEACTAAAQTARRRAGIEDPRAVELAEVSAPSAAGELLVVESLGLADPGRGVDLFEDDAPLAVNPSGGALPADPIMATGLVRLSEAARRLAGRVERDSAPPSSAIVHGTGGVAMQNHCVMTLEA